MATQKSSSLNAAAEKVGATLGRLAARADRLDRQRHELAEKIRQTIEHGHALLERLVPHKPEAEPVRKRRGNAKGLKATAESKAKVRDTWADARKKTTMKEKTHPTDMRATIRATEARRWTNRQAGRG